MKIAPIVDGDPTIDQPFAREIFCIETDGLASVEVRA